MNTLNQGTVTVSLPESVEIPARAGALSNKDLQRLPKAGDLAPICRETAEAMVKYPELLTTVGVSPELLLADGAALEALSARITDLEAMTSRLKQARLLLAVDAFARLRRVLGQVATERRFHAGVNGLVPRLIAFFARAKKKPAPQGQPQQ